MSAFPGFLFKMTCRGEENENSQQNPGGELFEGISQDIRGFPRCQFLLRKLGEGRGVFLIFLLAIEGVLLRESHLNGHVSKTSVSPLDPERALPGRVCLCCLHPTPTRASLVATDLPVQFTHFLLQESTEDERI